MPPKMVKVKSSMVSELGYDDDARELHVIHRDGTPIVYQDVPAGIAGQVLQAGSVGRCLNSIVRKRFKWRVADTDEYENRRQERS